MAKTIEQRVVEFKFNNANFEQNVAQSMNTLDDLNKKVKESTSGKAFDELTKSAKSMDLSSVTTSLTTVTEKFSAMKEIAIGALRDIGVSIEQNLVNGLKKVTLEPVTKGFTRFGQKTESVATIMAAIADEDYGDVDKLEYTEALLEKLAWFSDETSYNFTDMTDNIAKFTAAGLDLDTSTTAMMGIATWAANAGQQADVASRAMYQLSQAMGSGSIKLQDWKSIETANMATKEVKQMLIDYGKLMGKIQTDQFGTDFVTYIDSLSGEEKTIDINIGNFRDTLTKSGWLDSDVFSAAMGEYASYAEALEKVINSEANADLDLYATDVMKKMKKALKESEKTGETLDAIMLRDYGIDLRVEDENGNLVSAMENVTEIGIRAMESAQKARTLKQAFDALDDASSTKWAGAFEKVLGNMEEASELFTYISEVLYDWFAEPLNSLNDMLRTWKEFGGRASLFGYFDEEGELVNGAFQNIIDAMDGYKEAIGKGFSAVFNPEGLGAEELGEKLAAATDRFREFTEAMIPSEETINKVASAVQTFLTPLKAMGGALGSAVSSAKSFASGIFGSLSKAFDYSAAVDSINKISDIKPKQSLELSFAGIDDQNIIPTMKAMESPLKTISNLFTNLSNVASKFFSALKPSEEVLGKLTTIFTAFKNVLNAVFAPLRSLNSGLEKLGDADSTKVEKFAEFLSGPLLNALLWLPSKIADVINKMTELSNKFEIFEKIKGVFSSAKQAVSDFFGGFYEAFWEANTADRGWLEQFSGEKIEGAVTPLNALGAVLTGVRKRIEEFFSSFKDISIFEKISNGLSSIKEWFEKASSWSSGANVFYSISNTFDRLKDAVTKVKEAIFGAKPELEFAEFSRSAPTIETSATKISEAINKIVDAIKNFFSSDFSFGSIVDNIKSFFGIGKDKQDEIIAEAETAVNTIAEEIQTKVTSAWSHLKPRKKKIKGQAGDANKSEDPILDPDGTMVDITASGNYWLDQEAMYAQTGGALGKIDEYYTNLLHWYGNYLQQDLPDPEPIDGIPLQSFIDSLISMFGANSPLAKKSFDPDTSLSTLEEVSEDLPLFAKILNGIKTGLSTFFSALGNVIGAVLYGGGKGVEMVIGVINKMFDIAGKIKNSEGFKTAIGTIVDVLKHVSSKLKEFTESETFKAAFSSITGVIEYVIDNFLKIAPKIAGLMAAKGAMSFGSGFNKIGKGFLEIAGQVGKFAKAANKFGQAAKLDAIASLLKSIALVIVAIAASIAIFKLVDIKSLDEIVVPLGAMAALLAEVFGGISLVIHALGSGDGLAGAAKEAAGGAVLIGLAPMLLAIGALLAAASGAIGSLVNVFKDVPDWETAAFAVLTVMGIVIELFGGIALVLGQAKTPKALSGTKGLMVGLAALLKIIESMVVNFMAFPLKQLGKAVGAVEILLLGIAKIMTNIGKMAAVPAKNLFTATLVLAALAGIMYEVGALAKTMAGMSIEQMTPTMIVVGGSLVAIALVCEAVKKMVMGVSPTQLAAGALVLGVIGGIIYAIGDLMLKANSSGVTRGGGGGGLMENPSLLALAGTLLSLIVVAEILKTLANDSDAGSLVKAATAMKTMASAVETCSKVVTGLAALASNDLEGLALGIAAFAAILLVLVGVAYLVKEDTAKSFAIFATAVGALGVGIGLAAAGIAKFVETMIYLGDRIAASKGSIKNGIEAIADVIAETAGSFVKALGAIIGAILQAFLDNKIRFIEVIFEFINTLLDLLIKWLPTILPKILQVLSMLVSALVTFLTETLLPAIGDVLNTLINTIFDLLTGLWNRLKIFLTQVLTDITVFLNQLIDAIQLTINNILTSLTDIVTKIEGLLNQIIDSIESVLSNIITSVTNLINQIIDAIETTAINIITSIENVLNQIIESITNVLSNIITSIENIINQIIDVIENTATNLITSIENVLNQIVDSIENVLNNIIDSIENVLSNIIESIGNIINQIIDTIENSANNLIDSVESILNNIVDSIESVFQNILDSVFGLLEDIVDKIVGFADKIKTAALDLLQKFVDGIIEATDIVLTGIHDLIVGKDGKGGIVGHIGTFGKDLAEAAGRMIASFIEGIDNAVDSVLTAIKNMIVGEDGDGGIVGKIGDFGSDLVKAAGKLIAKFIEGINGAVDSVMTAIKNLIVGENGDGGIIGKVGDFGKQVAEAGGKMIGKFVEGIGNAAGTVMSAVDSLFNGNNTAENPGIIARLGSFAGNLISSGGQAAASIAEGISKGAKPLISAVDELFNGDGSDENPGILKSIGNFAGKLLTAGGEAVASVATGFRDGAGAAIDAFMSIFDGVKDESGNVIEGKEGILDKIGMLVNSLVDAIIRLINSLADTLRTKSPEFISACGNLADAIISSIPIVGGAYKLGKSVIGSIVSAFRGERKDAEDEGETTGGGIVQGLIRGVGGFAETLGTTVSNVASGIWNGFKNFFGIHSPSTLFTTGGEYLMQGLQNGIEGSDDGPINAMSSIGQSLYDEFNSYQNKFKIAGKMAGDTIGMGAEESDSVTRAAEKLAASVKPGFDKKDSVLKTAGAWASYYVSQGMDNNHSYTEKAAKRLADATKTSFVGVDFSGAGYHVVSGINKGIDDNKWRVADKAAKLGGDVKNAVTRVLEINSPSRVMMEIGKFVDMGLAKGIDKYSDNPLGSANDVATMLVYAMSNAMRMAEAALAEDTYTPTISPVIDLAQVQSGINEMNGMLYSADGYSLDAAMRSRYNPYENFDGTEKLDPTLGILGSVDGVTEKLDEMISKLSQLKVYLDSGALVGGIFDQVDLALGKKAIYSGRGVM